MALLVVHSEALKCVADGDISTLSPEAKSQMQAYLAAMKNQEDCDGVCVFLYYRGSNGNSKIAGCDARPAKMGAAQSMLVSMNAAIQQHGEMDFVLAFCSEEKCNTAESSGSKAMNILDAMKTEVAVLNKPRSTNLVCSKTGSCQGICAIGSGNGKTNRLCLPDESSKITQYSALTIAKLYKDKNEFAVVVSCATDNCNADGSEANTALDNMLKKVEAAVNSSGNISHGFVLFIFIAMIFTIVDL